MKERLPTYCSVVRGIGLFPQKNIINERKNAYLLFCDRSEVLVSFPRRTSLMKERLPTCCSVARGIGIFPQKNIIDERKTAYLLFCGARYWSLSPEEHH